MASRFVVDYCAAHPEAVAAVETELELSTEMAGLLPLKINRLKARMAVNNWRTPLFTGWLGSRSSCWVLVDYYVETRGLLFALVLYRVLKVLRVNTTVPSSGLEN